MLSPLLNHGTLQLTTTTTTTTTAATTAAAAAAMMMMMTYVNPYACKTAHKIHLPHICKQADLFRVYSIVRV